MRVKCISNKGDGLNECNLIPKKGYDKKTSFDITVGKEYIVYCVAEENLSLWYYIEDDVHDDLLFPVWHPAELFEVIDNKISKTWVVGIDKSNERSEIRILLSFPEWITNSYYYDELTNGDRVAVDLYKKYKKIIDNENI